MTSQHISRHRAGNCYSAFGCTLRRPPFLKSSECRYTVRPSYSRAWNGLYFKL